MSLKRKRPIEEIIQSRQIKFIIGSGKTEYLVHESSFSCLSQPLRALLSNGMQESVTGTVVWDDVDESTFHGLLDFAYRDNTDTAAPVLRETVSSPALSKKTCRKASDEPNVCFDSVISWMLENDIDSPKYQYCMLNLTYSKRADANAAYYISDHAKDMKRKDRTCYRQVFMFHAKLYVVADKYIINGLKIQCLQKMRVSLLNVPGSAELLDALRDVIAYVYDNTVAPDYLRAMLLRYCVAQIYWLKKSGFLARMRDDLPDFLADLLLEFPLSW